MGRIKAGFVLFGLGLFMAALSWDGAMDEFHGRRAAGFAWIINGAVERFGHGGSTMLFAGGGLALALISWFRPQRT